MRPPLEPAPDHMRVLGPSDPESASDPRRGRDAQELPDRELAALADRQHGVVARRQLAALGVSDTMTRDRVRRGLLRRVHRGVYALGHRHLRNDGHWLAAVLAAGPGAALSHRDAAALHGLRHPHGGRTDVTTRARAASTQRLRVHRTTVLGAEDTTIVDGIPVTTVARTLVDLASVVAPHQLAKALDAAERIHRVDVGEIERVLARTRHRRGGGYANMRAVLAEAAAHGTQLTRSDLEARFAALVVAHGLPRPRHNAFVHGFEVDALWEDARLAVEVDSYAFHHTRAAIQRDRDKDHALELIGYRVVRFTDDDVVRRPSRTAQRIRAALARRAAELRRASGP